MFFETRFGSRMAGEKFDKGVVLKGGSGGGGVVKGRKGSWADKTLFRLLDQNKTTVSLIFF